MGNDLQIGEEENCSWKAIILCLPTSVAYNGACDNCPRKMCYNMRIAGGPVRIRITSLPENYCTTEFVILDKFCIVVYCFVYFCW